MEETKNSGEPSSYRESQSFKQNYAGTFVGKSEQKQEVSVNTQNETTDPEGKPLPMELKWLRDPQNHQPIVAGSAIAIVVVTAIYAVFAGIQSCAMLESNRINHDSLIAVQRAFIHFKQVEAKGVMIKDDPTALPSRQWNFIATFENSGNTPAIEVVNTFNIIDHLPTGQEFIHLVKQSDLRKTVVGPKAPLYLGPQRRTQDFLFGADALKPAAKFKTFLTDRTVIFLGWIAYRDAFPATELHITEFCQQLAVITLAFKENPPKVLPTYPLFDFSFQACREHNCTDEYCPDYKELEAFISDQQPESRPSDDPFGIEKIDKRLDK